jgi:hypothetical protein
VNLARHTKAFIHIRNTKELDHITSFTSNITIQDQSLFDRFDRNARLKFYLKLDQILVNDFMGQIVQFQDIVAHIKYRYPALHEEIIHRSQILCSVLD